MKTYIGVDYHLSYSYMTVMDQTGRICARGRVANDREAVKQFLSGVRQDGRRAAASRIRGPAGARNPEEIRQLP